jgi:hypothetical protein
MEDIEKQVINWHQETFPNATIMAIKAKFSEEVAEFNNSFDYYTSDLFNDESIEEFADMCIVYMSGLAKLGKPSLTSIIAAKLEINKARIWGKEVGNGDRPRDK